MQSQLRLAVGEDYAGVGNPTTLDDLADAGISRGKVGSSVEQAKLALVRVDDAKLDAAVRGDTQAVRPAETIDSRVETIDRQAKRIDDSLTAAETHLEASQKRLEAMFAAMETALGNAQTQQTWLAD